MKSWGLPLWDVLTGRKPGAAARSRASVRPPAAGLEARRGARGDAAARARPAAPTMADRYERIARSMLATHGIKVRKWRTAMSGVAWELKYDDGSVRRYIEAPRPRGPMSVAIFLHEIGHHAIGFNRYRPRCLEEFHAWRFAIEQMEAHGLNVTASVRRRMHVSLHYAIAKARRRGLAALPVELEPFVTPPPRSTRVARR